MQELEKILEEIGELRGQAGSECTSEDHYIKKAWEHCLDRVVDIIRKHMNDGWLSVEERLPEEPPEEVDDEDNLEEYIVMIEGAEKPTILRHAGDGPWWEDGTYYPVIAWRPLPEPYRPERSEE